MFLGLGILPCRPALGKTVQALGSLQSFTKRKKKTNGKEQLCSRRLFTISYSTLQCESFVLCAGFNTCSVSQTPSGDLFTVTAAGELNSQMMFVLTDLANISRKYQCTIETSSMTNTHSLWYCKKGFYVNNVRNLKNNTEYLCLIQRP